MLIPPIGDDNSKKINKKYYLSRTNSDGEKFKLINMFVHKLNMVRLLVLLLLPIHVLCNQDNDELSLTTATKSNDNTATSIKSSTLKNSKSFLSPNGSVVIVDSNVNNNNNDDDDDNDDDDGGNDGGDGADNNDDDDGTSNGIIINHQYPKAIKQLPSITSGIGAGAAVHNNNNNNNNNLYDEKQENGGNGDSDGDVDNKNRFRRSALVPESTSYIEPPITWNYLRRFICGTSNQKCMNDERLNSLKSDFLRQLSQKIPTDIDLRKDYFSNDMNIWNSLNLSGRREGPLYVEEPDFVVRKEDDDIAAQLFVDYLDDPFIPQRGRRRYNALSTSLSPSSSSSSSPSSSPSTVDNNMKILILPIGSDASTDSINGFPIRRHLFDNSDDETKSVNSNYYRDDTYFKRGNERGGGSDSGSGSGGDVNQKYTNKKIMEIKRLKLIRGGGGGDNNGKLKTGKWLAAGDSFIQQTLNNNEHRCCNGGDGIIRRNINHDDNNNELSHALNQANYRYYLTRSKYLDEQQQNYLLHQLLKDHHYHLHPQQQQLQQQQQQLPQLQQRYQPGQNDAFKLKLTKQKQQQNHNDDEQNNRMHLIEYNLSPPQNDRDIFYYTRGRRTTSK